MTIDFSKAIDALTRFDKAIHLPKHTETVQFKGIVIADARRIRRVVNVTEYRTTFWGNIIHAATSEGASLLDEEGSAAGRPGYSPETRAAALRYYELARLADSLTFPMYSDPLVQATLRHLRKLLRYATLYHGRYSRLADEMLRVFEVGFVPIVYRGEFPNGYYIVFAASCDVNSTFIKPSDGDIAVAKPVKRKCIDRRELPTTDVPVRAVHPQWSTWSTHRDPALAFCDIFRPLIAGDAGRQVVEALAQRTLRITRGADNAKLLDIHLRGAVDGSVEHMLCAAPWAGLVAGLSDGVVRMLRTFNGIWLDIIAWHPYRGAKGFDVEWDVWSELPDNHDGLWTKKPIAPFTDGSDLWVYHPAQMQGTYLALMKLDHEGGTLEAEPEQDPVTRFLRLIESRVTPI